MAPRTTSGLKREATHSYGLATPDESFASGSGYINPKAERSESVSFSDKAQEKYQFDPHRSRPHGLPSEIGDFSYEAAERQRRSASVSVRSSYPPPPQPQFHPPNHLHNPRYILNEPLSSPATMSPPAEEEETGLQAVGREVKRLVDTLQELRRIGIQEIDHHLPELVLVGDQSAGKSSVMGAIAEINLPKGSGTCTRCPTNIKTTSANKWSCKISLHEAYAWVATKKKVAGQTFPHWLPQVPVVKDFASVSEKGQLENVLKWAQIALLNPSEGYSSFIPGTDGHARQVQEREMNPGHEEQAMFSPNVINVEISGPGLPALSFYDLPGLFNAAKTDEEEFLIKVFDDLTAKYIKHEKALIICAINMASDPGVSKTKSVITKERAQDRCIGVLTMPDRLQNKEKAHQEYDDLLHKKTFVLPRGYFVTKQPGPNFQHNGNPDYHRIARQEETEFFDSHSLWAPGREWEAFRSKCGTGTITQYLSAEFAKLILSSIPDIEQRIQEESEKVDRELNTIPEISNDKVQFIVRQELDNFSREAQSVLDGNPGQQTTVFQSDWIKLCEQFQATIKFMRPGCICTHPDDDPSRNVIVIDDDEDDDTGATYPTPGKNTKKRSTGETEQSPAFKKPFVRTPIKSEGSANPLFSPQPDTPKYAPARIVVSRAYARLRPADYGPFFNRHLDIGHGAMSLESIQQEIQRCARSGVPGFVNHKVKEMYSLASINPWDQPLKIFLNETFRILRREILQVLDRVLKNYQGTELYKRSRRIVESFLDHHEGLQRARSENLLEMERSALFTINNDQFSRNREEEYNLLSKTRRNHRVKIYVISQPKPNGKERDLEELMAKVDEKQLPVDRFVQELKVAAYIRGYYTTARMRFTDSVCANINVSLFQTVKKGLKWMLEEHLKIDAGGEALCQELLSGNAQLVQRRKMLKEKKAKLTEFSRVLSRLRRPDDGPIFPDASDSESGAFVPEDDLDMIDAHPQIGTPQRQPSSHGSPMQTPTPVQSIRRAGEINAGDI